MKPQSTTSQSQHVKSETQTFKIPQTDLHENSWSTFCLYQINPVSLKKKVWRLIFWSFLFGLTYFFRNCICPQQAVLYVLYDRGKKSQSSIFPVSSNDISVQFWQCHRTDRYFFLVLWSSFSNLHLGGHPVLWILELWHESRDSTHLKWQFWWFYIFQMTFFFKKSQVHFLKKVIIWITVVNQITWTDSLWSLISKNKSSFLVKFFLTPKKSSLFRESHYFENPKIRKIQNTWWQS